MVTRKTGFSAPKEKKLIDVPRGRKAPSVKIEDLSDAYQDGKWTVPVGGEIVVERKLSGKRQRSLCIVRTVSDNLVETWEETFDRWFSFNPAELEKGGVVVKILPNK
jgi:hypothetical protein